MCHGCGGNIAPLEPHLVGNASHTCASCVLTAVASLLPGTPARVLVRLREVEPERDGAGMLRFDVSVQDAPGIVTTTLGIASVEQGIPADQRAPALLGVVWHAVLAWAQATGRLRALVPPDDPRTTWT